MTRQTHLQLSVITHESTKDTVVSVQGAVIFMIYRNSERHGDSLPDLLDKQFILRDFQGRTRLTHLCKRPQMWPMKRPFLTIVKYQEALLVGREPSHVVEEGVKERVLNLCGHWSDSTWSAP